ncbi:MAG: hypothetical protein P4N60_09505 [Verrucomicrobiae bacterium]|nr:hypothetical protein [Verrucomicrobiae bacterium]
MKLAAQSVEAKNVSGCVRGGRVAGHARLVGLRQKRQPSTKKGVQILFFRLHIQPPTDSADNPDRFRILGTASKPE